MKDYFKFEKNKWFFEEDVPYDTPRIKIGIKIEKKLYSGKSDYQRIEFFDTYVYGKILVLDGILQTSEKDEFIYHEMLCHLPMFLHKNPKRILIIGGGDGGSLEEVLKHNIEKVWMVEIDKKVIELSKKYIPSISKGAFKNKKAEIIIGDGKEYIKRHKNFFDVIILDLSDPLGPSKELISLNFYQDVKRALRKDGVISIQSGSLNDQPELVSKIFGRIKKIFPFADIYQAVIPSYQTGEYSFIVGVRARLDKLQEKNIEKKYKKSKFKLKYFSPEIYLTSRVLPKYLAEKIGR
ncbi:MAG TPA: polyamine aminopropyltransferase [Candidatus Paceibacterota bacterium]|nr:polyamine aminopropyltransferase [Candidatus Paceibacterota bacterium]